MKTLGRILIILLAAAIASAAIIGAVNATRSINFSGRPEGGDFRPQGDQQFQGDRPQGGFPEGGFPGERPDDREGGGGSFSRMALGLVKNSVIIGLLVVVIAVPRSLLSKRKRSAPQGDTTSLNEDL